MGELAILNVGEGDTKLVLDNPTPEEKIHPAKTIKDMVRRGYAILVEVGKDEKGPLYRRVHDFDENTLEYIIAGGPEEATEKKNERVPRAGAAKRRGGNTQRVRASDTNAVAVARTAGG